jgi:carbamoyl-phosphate synthase large subunit
VAKAFQPGQTTVDLIASGVVNLIINTPLGQQAHADQTAMRSAAIQHDVLLISTLSAAQAAVNGKRALRQKGLQVRSLQAHHGVELR